MTGQGGAAAPLPPVSFATGAGSPPGSHGGSGAQIRRDMEVAEKV